MYEMKPRHSYIELALKILVGQPQGGVVVVFHRDITMNFGDLLCHRTAHFPDGTVQVANKNEALDCFASFIMGFGAQDIIENSACKAVQDEWRNVCRALGRRDPAHPDHLIFSSPDTMVVSTRDATALPEIAADVPIAERSRTVKNSEARFHSPSLIWKPKEIQHVQHCARWAAKNGIGRTIIGGGHSGQCLRPNVVAVDMDAFDQTHILGAEDGGRVAESGCLVVAGAGCKTGDIIRKTMAVGMTVPLDPRPSVGTGLWLHGGIGYLARLHGLSCDSVVGAVVVSVGCGQVFCVGFVPSQQRPACAVRPENGNDL